MSTILRLILIAAAALSTLAGNWPQFRGPGGHSVGEGPEPPSTFGAASNVLWQVALPPGNSSPVIWEDRIFLTAQESNHLVVLALDRRDGHRLWTHSVLTPGLEPTHRLGSPASPTPCTDGERVYAYFGSHGVVALDLNGKLLWRRELPAPVVEFGTSASPILHGDVLILSRDQDDGSHLLALDRTTGATVWRRERPEFRRSFSTPYLWNHDGTTELIVPGSIALVSYAPATGEELWRHVGTSRVATSSPTGGDGLLFTASWNVGGDSGSRVTMPRWKEFAPEGDANHDGVAVRSEVPPGPIAERFSQMDFNKDGTVTPVEWDAMADMFTQARNGVLAFRPAPGTAATNRLAWSSTRSLPYVSSPLYHRGRLFTVKNGGLASAYDAATGKVLFQDERLGVNGDYYSSAVACDDRIYVASQEGTVVVLRAGDTLEVLARNALGESVFATPAISDGTLYVRTTGHLFAFHSGADTR
ncbi:MAG: PQQ-binding-like beta-propeller repeat protein [Verrucomicrobiales bacterium]|nr:PQQ-binding-like beta-propeller repeat protein [Verrucomicrobiales bacterium]